MIIYKLVKQNLKNLPMKKSTVVIVILLIILTFSAGIFYIIFRDFSPAKSEFDVPDKQNDKMVNMLNEEIDKEINNHTQSVMYPGYIPEARQHTIDFLKTIKSIESYARYGVKSTQPRNYIELKITFNDGSVADNVYTGHSCNAYVDTCLLLKVEMKDGKAVKVFTNGQEKKGSPDWIKPDLNLLIEKAINYDINTNKDQYFGKPKTQKDFDKEWQEQK
jgi:hypothetical protein